MIREASRHENQVFSLNHTVNVTVYIYFDSASLDEFAPLCCLIKFHLGEYRIILYLFCIHKVSHCSVFELLQSSLNLAATVHLYENLVV